VVEIMGHSRSENASKRAKKTSTQAGAPILDPTNPEGGLNRTISLIVKEESMEGGVSPVWNHQTELSRIDTPGREDEC
jgi:hypothetical protein